MGKLEHRQQKIQEKRKSISFRDFVMEIASWMPMNIYKNNEKISRFPSTGREPILVNPKDFGKNIAIQELDGDFLENFGKLYKDQEQMTLMQWFENENCDYAEVYGCKNCYLSFGVGTNAENVLYSCNSCINLHNIYNSFAVIEDCSNIYSSRVVTQSSNIFFSSDIHGSNEIWFSNNMLGCYECILCDGLNNQKYCINNEQLAEIEYFNQKKLLLKSKELYDDLHEKVLEKPSENKLSSDISGEGITSSQNVENGFFVNHLINGRNVFATGSKTSTSNLYDCIDCGNDGDEHLYGTHYTGEHSSHVYCSSSMASCHNAFYSYFLENCSFCLGCIGLKNKSYCILNKQYTKEEWYQKVDEIFSQMEADGTLGYFFPATMNPFYFNDTAAYLIDPSFTKEEMTAKGYLRRDEPIKVDIPEGAQVIKTTELGQFEGFDAEGNRKINEVICKKVIIDESGNAYRVIPMELAFLNKYGLPLPRKHRLDRMKENFRIS